MTQLQLSNDRHVASGFAGFVHVNGSGVNVP